VLQALPSAPDLPAWLTPVGAVYRYATDRQITDTRIIQFSYLQRELPTIPEAQLAVYFHNGASWQRLATSIDSDRNLAAAKMDGSGIYALMATVQLPTFSLGWNNFGYPLAESRPITQALASIDGKYSSVYHFDPVGSPQWALYDTTVRAPFATLVNDLTTLEFGQAYWLYATESATGYLPVDGRQATSFALPPLTLYGEIGPQGTFSPTAGMAIEARINGTVCGTGTVVALPDRLAYKVQVSAETPFGTPNNCGADGRSVSLHADGQTLASNIAWELEQAQEINLANTIPTAVALNQQAAVGSTLVPTILLILLLTALGMQLKWHDKSDFHQ